MTLASVRELHEPVVSDYTSLVYCYGCDADGWPCRTAELVYSQGEIDDTLQAAKWQAKWLRQMKDRNPAQPKGRWLGNIYGKLIEYALRADQIYKTVLAPTPNGVTVSFDVQKIASNSKQFLEDSA